MEYKTKMRKGYLCKRLRIYCSSSHSQIPVVREQPAFLLCVRECCYEYCCSQILLRVAF